MGNLRKLLKISRPRFWFYIAGTFAVGYIAGANEVKDLATLKFFYLLFFFLLPANFFLYGINDLFDWETDHYNVKKDSKEYRFVQSDKRQLVTLLAVSFFFSLFVFFIVPQQAALWFALFQFLSFFYSAEPLRFKKRRYIDFISNFLYIIPGIVGYLINATQLNFFILLALFFWTSAMHLFSAIPDIEADKKAGIYTSAVYFGYTRSLVVCFLFWLLFAVLSVWFNYLFFLAFIYPSIPLILLLKKNISIDRVYWYYPYINAFIGFILYWYLAFKNIL